MDLGLNNKVVLVTGASGGIGSATARAFVQEGAKVGLHYHQNAAAARELARDLGPQTLVTQGNLASAQDCSKVFAETIETFGAIDALVVNAGIWPAEHKPIHEMSLEQWSKTLEHNLTSAFLCCQAFLGHLVKETREEASIVLIGSTAGHFGEEGHVDYSASKAAIAYGLTKTLKNEIVRLAPRGRVNCVNPGWVMTPMAEATLDQPDALENATKTMALRKAAKPEEVAATVLWLSSSTLAGHITGAVVPVDGGMEGRTLHLV